jgi:hypothetical protein
MSTVNSRNKAPAIFFAFHSRCALQKCSGPPAHAAHKNRPQRLHCDPTRLLHTSQTSATVIVSSTREAVACLILRCIPDTSSARLMNDGRLWTEVSDLSRLAGHIIHVSFGECYTTNAH